MDTKTIIDKTMQHHKRIVAKSIENAKPTKKKNNISLACGGALLLASIPAKFMNDTLALGLLTAGIVQVTFASLQRVYLQKKK